MKKQTIICALISLSFATGCHKDNSSPTFPIPIHDPTPKAAPRKKVFPPKSNRKLKALKVHRGEDGWTFNLYPKGVVVARENGEFRWLQKTGVAIEKMLTWYGQLYLLGQASLFGECCLTDSPPEVLLVLNKASGKEAWQAELGYDQVSTGTLGVRQGRIYLKGYNNEEYYLSTKGKALNPATQQLVTVSRR